jgi:hypothetical protein
MINTLKKCVKLVINKNCTEMHGQKNIKFSQGTKLTIRLPHMLKLIVHSVHDTGQAIRSMHRLHCFMTPLDPVFLCALLFGNLYFIKISNTVVWGVHYTSL